MGGQEIVHDGLVEAMGPLNSDSSPSVDSTIDTVLLVDVVNYSVLTQRTCRMCVMTCFCKLLVIQ